MRRDMLLLHIFLPAEKPFLQSTITVFLWPPTPRSSHVSALQIGLRQHACVQLPLLFTFYYM